MVTAVLHSRGLIVELNPLMRTFIDKSEWLFAAVKGLTLIGGWIVLAWYAKSNPQFVRKLSYGASAAYVTLWFAWFIVNVR